MQIINKFQISNFKFQVSRSRGVALVAVLAILTVLAIFAASFAVLSKMENEISTNILRGMEAKTIAESGIEHVKTLLWYDTLPQKNQGDSYNDIWCTSFNGKLKKKKPEVDVDLISKNGPKKDGKDSIWIPVHNKNNELIGRYAVAIEDESAKINLNVASMVPPLKPNEGISTYELLLTDNKKKGIPVKRKAIIRFLKERYGPNCVPGRKGDDNFNNSYYMSDELDNDADGLIDEIDEGIEEWEEYVANHPSGDDKSFFNLTEVAKIFEPDAKLNSEQLAKFRSYSTLFSFDKGRRFDADSKKWVPRENLNVTPPRKIFKTLKTANTKHKFGNNSKELRRMAACLSDYRDENTVLSTVSSEYGVESVCFNEVLANEGSIIKQTYETGNRSDDPLGNRRTFNLAYYYGHYNYGRPHKINTSHPVIDLQETNVVEREMYNQYVVYPIYTNFFKEYPKYIEVGLRGFPLKGTGPWDGLRDFKDLLEKRGGKFIDGSRIVWPDNIWKNGYLSVYETGAKENDLPKKSFKIRGNTEDRISIDKDDISSAEIDNFKNRTYRLAQIRTWTHEKSYYAEHPRVSNWFVFPRLKPNTYYRVYVQMSNLEIPKNDDIGGFLYSKKIDVDGIIDSTSSEEFKRKRCMYKKGKAIRSDKIGCIDAYVTSSSTCGPKSRNRINSFYFSRPDIIELINVSSRPISLRGWSFVANTGARAYDLGKINSSVGYSKEDGGKKIETNPIIRPNEYFYLCNNIEIFDRDFGGVKNGSWGATSSEQMPIHEFDDDKWGVQFEIKNIREGNSDKGWTTYIKCNNESWKTDQFKDEVVEFQTAKEPEDYEDIKTPDGVRVIVSGNTKDTLIFENLKLKEYSGIRAGDYVMIVGMPRVGGFLSMTLKNEYDQVVTRLLEYGNPGRKRIKNYRSWVGWSAEKTDPTRELWSFNKRPTLGGTLKKSKNKAAKLSSEKRTSVKNGPFASVGEVFKVRNIAEWKKNKKNDANVTNKKFVQGVADYFTTSGIRLDAEDENAHLSGWKPAFGKSSFADTKGMTDYNAAWQKDEWKNQRLTMMTGPSRGETFAVEGNNATRIKITGRSVPGRKKFYVQSDDKYSLGPGYSSAFYYTKDEVNPGEWEWKNRHIPKGTYKLYLAGLNDSIKTTEFLEENFNAKLDVFIFNYDKNEYKLLAKRKQYQKNDMFFAGEINPQNISASGGIRIKLVPHGVQAKYSSGFAWFDYAYITPIPVLGKININTAAKRVLMALNKIDQKIANNIYYGIDSHGKAKLKPYNSISEILSVKGITPEIFSGIANLITARSDIFNVYVLAERIKDINKDGKFDKGVDEVLATSKIRTLIDRSELTLNKTGENGTIRVIQTEKF